MDLGIKTFAEKIELLNSLLKEVGPVYDYDNPEYYISEVRYDSRENKVFADFKEDYV